MWCRCVLVVMTAFALQPPEDVLSDGSDDPPPLADANSSDDGLAGHRSNAFNIEESSGSDSSDDSDDEFWNRAFDEHTQPEYTQRHGRPARDLLQSILSPSTGASTTHMMQPMDSGAHIGFLDFLGRPNGLRGAHRISMLQCFVRPNNPEGPAAVQQTRARVVARVRVPDALGHSPTSSSSSSTSAPPHHGLAHYWHSEARQITYGLAHYM